MDETIFYVDAPEADQPVEADPHEARLARLEAIANELLRLNYHRSPALKEMWEKSQEG